MTRRSLQGLTGKILFPFLIIAVAIIAVGVLTTIDLERQAAHRSLRQRGEGTVQHLALALGEVSQGQSPPFQQLLQASQQIDREVAYAMLLSRDGQVLASTDPAYKGQTFNRTELEQSALAVSRLTWREMTPSLWEVVFPVRLSGNPEGVLRLGITTEQVEVAAGQTKLLLAALALAALLGGAGIYTLIIRRALLTPIGSLLQATQRLSEGDLTVAVETHGTDELSSLGQAISRMTEEIKGIVRKIQETADAMATTSVSIAKTAEGSAKGSEAAAAAIEEVTATMEELRTNTANIAQNTRNQASAVTQTSAAIEEMAASTQRIASEAHRLSGLSVEASQALIAVQTSREAITPKQKEANELLTKMAATIQTLGTKAEDIDQIVEVIDDIADQTNLLALNAAIEAARAGEHGLGFAVVAEEVRKLAERSAQSTKEISAIIQSIQTEVAQAVLQVDRYLPAVKEITRMREKITELMQHLSQAMNQVTNHVQAIDAATAQQSQGTREIAQSANALTEITQEISAATEEQSAGTAQVAQAMERMRALVQESAAATSRLVSSAEGLRRQAQELQEAASQFTLDGAASASKSARMALKG